MAGLENKHSPAQVQDTSLEASQHSLTHLGHLDDVWDVEIGLHRGQATANEVGLICFLPVHLARVLLRVHSHSPDAQLRAGPEHSDGDLSWGRQRSEKPLLSASGPTLGLLRGAQRRKLTAWMGQKTGPMAPSQALTSVGHHHFLDGFILQAPHIGGGSWGGRSFADAQEPQAPPDGSELQHLGSKNPNQPGGRRGSGQGSGRWRSSMGTPVKKVLVVELVLK